MDTRDSGEARDDDERDQPADLAETAWRGIERCRQGDWQGGLYWLSLVAQAKEENTDLPSLFYAYLGYGLARYQGRPGEGLELCQRAIELEFYQPENYYFLALTQLASGDRRAAYGSVERGLEVDSTHADLLELKAEMGERRPPVLPVLPRGNLVNRVLGKVRHRLLARGADPEGPESRS